MTSQAHTFLEKCTSDTNWLYDFKVELQGVSGGSDCELQLIHHPHPPPKPDLDMRSRAAISDSEACLMPKLAWYRLALTLSSIWVCVYLCVLLARER